MIKLMLTSIFLQFMSMAAAFLAGSNFCDGQYISGWILLIATLAIAIPNFHILFQVLKTHE